MHFCNANAKFYKTFLPVTVNIELTTTYSTFVLFAQTLRYLYGIKHSIPFAARKTGVTPVARHANIKEL
jgi:hypothetical protein